MREARKIQRAENDPHTFVPMTDPVLLLELATDTAACLQEAIYRLAGTGLRTNSLKIEMEFPDEQDWDDSSEAYANDIWLKIESSSGVTINTFLPYRRLVERGTVLGLPYLPKNPARSAQ